MQARFLTLNLQKLEVRALLEELLLQTAMGLIRLASGGAAIPPRCLLSMVASLVCARVVVLEWHRRQREHFRILYERRMIYSVK